MPIRSQTRPTASPSAAVQSPGPTSGAGAADRRQRTLGNQAVQESLGLGAPGPTSDPGVCETAEDAAPAAAAAQAALRANTDDVSVSVRGRVAEHACLGEADGGKVLAGQDTTFEVGV